jgi:ferrous iron transport protein B
VGKSVVFNSLTGTYVDVSNFPGTTVELMRGSMGDADVVDTPGVYGSLSFNDEERVARDVILEADTVVNVVDAVHLERDLFLTCSSWTWASRWSSPST